MSIQCRGLSYEYDATDGAVLALQDVTFHVANEEFVCIVGPSGCGKTTLLKLIAGLLQSTSGSIHFDEKPKGQDLRTAMVFQEHGLYPWMSVLDNVSLGLQFQGIARNVREQHSMHLIRQFGLEAFAQRYPHELSVGMRQRVSLARAFVMQPQGLLMDEPFASLDALNKAVLQEELLRTWRAHKRFVIYVTHDIDEAMLLGDRVLVMSAIPGTILESFTVPLPRPRCRENLTQQEVAIQRQRIWRILESEARKALAEPT